MGVFETLKRATRSDSTRRVPGRQLELGDHRGLARRRSRPCRSPQPELDLSRRRSAWGWPSGTALDASGPRCARSASTVCLRGWAKDPPGKAGDDGAQAGILRRSIASRPENAGNASFRMEYQIRFRNLRAGGRGARGRHPGGRICDDGGAAHPWTKQPGDARVRGRSGRRDRDGQDERGARGSGRRHPGAAPFRTRRPGPGRGRVDRCS